MIGGFEQIGPGQELDKISRARLNVFCAIDELEAAVLESLGAAPGGRDKCPESPPPAPTVLAPSCAETEPAPPSDGEFAAYIEAAFRMPPVKVVLGPGAKAPERKTDGAAGFDLYATARRTVRNRLVTEVVTNVRVQIPDGYYAQVCLRSSLGSRGICIPNGIGVIDSDYRGPIVVFLTSLLGDDEYEISPGDRIGQLVFLKCESPEIEIVDELDPSERGEGGFGSTGR